MNYLIKRIDELLEKGALYDWSIYKLKYEVEIVCYSIDPDMTLRELHELFTRRLREKVLEVKSRHEED